MVTTPSVDAELPPRPATIYDVARVAGVSHQTVSRLLKGESNIGPKRRQRIEDALRELSYTPNEAARTLATRKPRKIGAVITDLQDWAPQQILRGAADAARAAGYVLDIVAVDVNDEAKVGDALAVLNRRSHAGAIVLASSDATLTALERIGLDLPYVLEIEAPLVPGDAAIAAHSYAQIVDHLASLGHERFFEITGPGIWRAARVRDLVYRSRIEELGLIHIGAAEGDWGAASGYAAMATFDRHATAVVAANDLMALGAMFWLREQGLRVPEDVSVVGYDGLPEGQFYVPPLTTMTVDFLALGRHTVQKLLEIIEPAASKPVRLSTELTVRSSTGPVRHH
jgi:LacI family transcriptional regulator